MAWSPDGKQVATGAADKTLPAAGTSRKGTQVRAVEKAHENVVYAVAYSPKGDLLATGGDDKLVKFWNPADGKELRKGAGHGAAIYCLAFRPDGAQARLGLGRQDDPDLERRRRQGGRQARRPPRRRLLRSPSAPTASGSPRSATAATSTSGTSTAASRSSTRRSRPTR